jgi:hypothetical protein
MILLFIGFKFLSKIMAQILNGFFFKNKYNFTGAYDKFKTLIKSFFI